MILLDTNVLSGLMAGEAAVVAWLNQQDAARIWLTSITLFEAQMGLELLPPGRRRKALEQRFNQVLADDLQGRIVAFDEAAALAAARLAARRRGDGRPVDIRDTQIAGIAIARRATLATRNLRYFDDLPTPVVNPFER